jgi:phage shock protein PspC (stress-responsive transcriptional regulator)
MPSGIKKFQRSRTDRIIFGVCGGLANYFQVDATLIRVLFILLTLAGSFGFWLYIILALVTPLEPGDKLANSQAKDLAKEIQENAKKLGAEIQVHGHTTKNLLGLFILALGLMLLFQKFFHFMVDWRLLAPLLIIFLGLFLIIKHK